jgi:CheY-like chemotaxis protein
MEMRMREEDPLQKDVSVIRKAAERAASLTRQLLAFSRKQTMQPRVINLNQVIMEMKQMLCRLISEDIELETFPFTDLPNVKADPGQIEQVIMNLTINARDAMNGGGKLTIETGVTFRDEEFCAGKTEVIPGEYCFLAVSDTGIGMSKDVMDKVFEPFFTTKEVGKGTGLGLATVHGIVKQSGGHVSVYSELKQGTTVKVYLPVVVGDSEKTTRKIIGEEDLRGNETVFLVEDEDYVREMSIKALRNKGYNVIEAANGGEALLIAEEYNKKIDILVTDLVMPRMNGEQLARRLKKKNKSLKLLFMSGYTPNIVAKPERKTDLTPFLQKPFGPYELVRKVRIALDN